MTKTRTTKILLSSQFFLAEIHIHLLLTLHQEQKKRNQTTQNENSQNRMNEKHELITESFAGNDNQGHVAIDHCIKEKQERESS